MMFLTSELNVADTMANVDEETTNFLINLVKWFGESDLYSKCMEKRQ